MWDQISSIVVKYWVEFILGAIVAGGGFLAKRYIRLEKAERKREHEEELTVINESIRKETQTMAQQSEDRYLELKETAQNNYQELHKRIDDEVREKEQDMILLLRVAHDESTTNDQKIEQHVNAVAESVECMRAGLLSMQGHEFRANCRTLLDPNHVITLYEWETISEDYNAYKGLGGNHQGDTLFDAVKKKYEASLTK